MSHFSKDPRIFPMENGNRSKDLGPGCALSRGMSLLPGHSVTELGGRGACTTHSRPDFRVSPSARVKSHEFVAGPPNARGGPGPWCSFEKSPFGISNSLAYARPHPLGSNPLPPPGSPPHPPQCWVASPPSNPCWHRHPAHPAPPEVFRTEVKVSGHF